ncbi:MAG: zinc ribbon domain-containing protein [Acidobacteriia bacterium]|nr:zinc ribbon domain-containing protein [Terriglobia bacterium]
MARFCTNCGSPVGEDLKFCMNCGTQLAAPASAPAPSQPVAATAAPVAAGPAPVAPAAPVAAPVAAPAAAPAKKASPVVKIVIAVVAIFVFVTLASIGACVYIGIRAKRAVEQSVKVEEGGKTFKIQTPQGEIKVGEQPPSEGAVGEIPAYPGAEAVEGGGQFSFGDNMKIGAQEFLTDDPADKVADFYKEKLGPKLQVVAAAGRYHLSLTSNDEKHPSTASIDIGADEESGKTKITITNMSGTKEQ